MKETENNKRRWAPAEDRALKNLYYLVLGLVFLTFLFMVFFFFNDFVPGPPATTGPQNPKELSSVRDGKDIISGLVAEQGYLEVRAACTGCHSAELVTQNAMTREGWLQTIRWMQKTQNLPDLGSKEDIILTYLATHYAPLRKGRRQNLQNIEWYELDL